MCDPCGSCCSPCGPCNELSPQCYSGAELENIPQCPPRPPPPRPKCITIQQPPRLICKKRVIFVNKVVPEAHVVNRCKRIIIPKVVETTKVIKVPKLTWYSQLVKEPRIVYYPSLIPDPYVVCCAKIIAEPREVCQAMLCNPKPQVIDVPPPSEYCCYPTGPTSLKSNFRYPPCPSPPILPCPQFSAGYWPYKPFPSSPCSLPNASCDFFSPFGSCGPCGPCTPRMPYPPCGPCSPRGPCPPCGPCPPGGLCQPCGPCPPYGTYPAFGPFRPYPPMPYSSCGPFSSCPIPCL